MRNNKNNNERLKLENEKLRLENENLKLKNIIIHYYVYHLNNYYFIKIL